MASRGLCAADFSRIAANGFGDPQNAYAHSMAYFRDQVYVGTSRHSLALLKLFPPPDAPAMDPWPVPVPGRVQDLDMRGQIWRWDAASGRWANVHTSPLIVGRNGEDVPRDLAYRGMAVFQGRSDPDPALYVTSISTVARGTAARILRSLDGARFEAVSEPGLGNPDVSSFRAITPFDGHLFVPPAGEGQTFNSNRASVVLRSPDPATGRWETACAPGFGDPRNNGIFELAVFDGHLYAGTFNHFEGYEVWKTPATGEAPCRWTKVVGRGGDRGPLNEIAMSLCAFDGALYVGSAIQNGGYDRTNMVGPAAAEIIRIYPDDSWELVVGSPRRTPQGMKFPLSGMGPGFDNPFAGYMWRMAVHDGWLYTSTFDWTVFLASAGRPSRLAKRMIDVFGAERLIRMGGGFDLWRTRDGRNWVPVTKNGFGNPYNYGGRTLVSTPEGLFVGTANPFGPDVAVRAATGSLYAPNERGGAEVWLGTTHTWSEIGARPPTERQRMEVRTLTDDSRSNGTPAEPLDDPSPRRNGRAPRVLVTGATGFVGQHVLERLLACGERVRVLALPETVDDLAHRDRVDVVAGGLSDQASLDDSTDGIETVYHLAALLPGASYPDLVRVNVHGTENLLRACARTQTVRRFVFLSSVAVYGGPFHRREWPYTERSPLSPRGAPDLRNYGRSKVAAETLVERYASNFGFEYVILRAATAYGSNGKFVLELVRKVLTDPAAGLGLAASIPMQLVHVRDLSGDVMARAGSEPRAANEVFNVAGLEAPTYGDVAAIVRRLAGADVPRMPDASRMWRRYVVAYDVTKAQNVLGFLPSVDISEGLGELVESVLGTR